MRRFQNIMGGVAVAMATGFSAVADAGVLVDLDATTLPTGPLVNWTNQGSLGGTFTRGFSFHTPEVSRINGVKGVTLDGDQDWYTGPVAPLAITGNGSRAMYAWVYNPSHNVEETVVSWSRRGGPAGTHMALNHGHHPVWGAIAHWDAPDMSWGGREEANIWTCIAYSYDGDTGEASIYTNGELVERRLVGPLNTYSESVFGERLAFVVGCENGPDGSRSNSNMPGSLTIAKIRIYDAPLTSAEMADAYNSDAVSFGRDPVEPPVSVIHFTASSGALYRGQSAELSWALAGAESFSITPQVAVGGGENSAVVTPSTTTTYTLTATRGSISESKSVTIVVQSGAPVAHDQSLLSSQGAPVAISLVAVDPNPPQEGLTWAILREPVHGTLSGTAPQLTYSPAADFIGEDSFSFHASDGVEESNEATVTIRVNPPPVSPSAVKVLLNSHLATAAPGDFMGHLQSEDENFGETHTYQLVEGAGDTHNALFGIIGNQLLAGTDFLLDDSTPVSIRVRTTDSDGLSYEQVLTFQIRLEAQSVIINELFYDPPDNGRTQFIELHNPTENSISVAGWAFTRGISYTFPPGTVMDPGAHLVVAMDPQAFRNQFGYLPLGPFDGRLASQGERVTLRNAGGAVIDEVDYKAEFPWPISSSGGGPSMELVHPSLDNDLAGSWRASTSLSGLDALAYVEPGSTGWFYRNGITTPSSPANAWHQDDFQQDASWLAGRAPLGYGIVDNLPLHTEVVGMEGDHLSFFARRPFTVAAGEIPSALALRYSADDGIIIWINGTEVARRNVSSPEPPLWEPASSLGAEGLWYDVTISNAATLLKEGTNVIAVRVFNQSFSSSDVGFDLELIRPSAATLLQPSPGQQNTVYTEAAPPQIRQVAHTPQQPASSEATTITATVTDPQGVAQVSLEYQIVSPGNFIPARFPRTVPQILANPKGERPVNPAFEDPGNWLSLAMVDDGAGGDAVAADGVFTAVIPPQPHRTLMRYRIAATDLPGTSVRVPYADDPSLNFAYFVYDGVPDYVAATASVHPSGAGKVWPRSLLESVPVYHWIIRNEDMMTLQAYNSWEQFSNNGTDAELQARRAEDWEGAFVYDGVVYDHVGTRLRGGNSRYGDFDGRFPRGKRHYKFKFNKGKELQARDEKGRLYPEKWKSVAFGRMFGTKGGNSWGMPEEIGATLWSTFGVPTAWTHWAHFRVIDDADEAPDQYHGDFWGLVQVVEEYDSRFLDARNINKGNLYKMSDWIWDSERQRRYQSPDMVRDGSEFNNIRDNLHGGQSAAWLQKYVNYDSWYRYSAVAEAIRHYDVFPFTDNIRHALKNLSWHFEPTGEDPQRGVCTFLPYDWDASFGPSFNNGWDHATNALYGWDSSTQKGMPYINKPEMKIEHRNVLREFRDLVWQPDQVNGLIDHRAAVIAELSKADQDRWRNAPVSAGTGNDDPLTQKVQDMKDFSFTGWNGGSGPAVGVGGRGAHLDNLANAPDAGQLPQRPVVAYTGMPNHPADGLSFQSTDFADPQGPNTFAAMEWRIGRIHDPAAPAHNPEEDFVMEYTPVWQSGRLTSHNNQISIPLSSALAPGLTYRARVRMQDNTGRWSRWSEPYQFTATTPATLEDLQNHLMITEVMYHPAGPAPIGGSDEDFEYIELQNISEEVTLDLRGLRFTSGIGFDFSEGSILDLPPGARVIVVKNRAAFESQYGTLLPVTGNWESSQNLSNSGEQLVLSFGDGMILHDFTYSDRAPWPTEPDGDGSSLVLVDPLSAPDHNQAENWRASRVAGGTPGSSDRAFDFWLAQQGIEDPLADAVPGMSHAMVYALGAETWTNPKAALPSGEFITDERGDHFLVLSHRRRLNNHDVSYEVEASTDLQHWEAGPEVVEPYGAPLFNGDGTETARVRSKVALAPDSPLFLRLRIRVP